MTDQIELYTEDFLGGIHVVSAIYFSQKHIF